MRIALLTTLLSVSLLFGCGGGGSGGGSSDGGPSALQGQVVKGLTNGATVSLYSLSASGQRTLVASAVTDAQGAFSLPLNLQSGSVYLLEAVGGQYVNEITNVTEPLASPMRAVFVANGTETRGAISAISEAVALEVEKSTAPDKWSASSVASATTSVNQAFGIPSPFALRFVDLTSYVPGSDPSLTSADTTFSLHLGTFAGFLHELKQRNAGATFADGLSSFHRFTVGAAQDDQLSSVWMTGFMRFFDKVPALASQKTSIFASLGLPSDANADQFAGAQSTGQSLVTVPNWTLRFLSPRPMASQPTTDTVFNSRGALEGYRLGSVGSGAGFSNVGYASVAEVYGTAETAIGRWNRGYYYPQGATYDADSKQFKTTNLTASSLVRDVVYAAGVPATALPVCGRAIMEPQAQTKPFSTHNGSRTLTMDAASRIGFHFSNGTTFVGYNIVLRDDLNNVYTFASPGGADVPWQGGLVEANQEFGSGTLPLPSGETLEFRGMLAGVGGTKAVITISSNILTTYSIGLAAAFALPGTVQPCVPPIFGSGAVSSLPASGHYYMDMGFLGVSRFLSSLDFFSNGTPNPLGATGLTASSGVEKSGNNVAGIGVLMPTFSYGGNVSLVPRPYTYLQTPASPAFPATGSGSYHLIASTPFLVTTADQLISVGPGIQSASLTIQFDQNPPGTTNAYDGTCQLTINGQSVQASDNRYFRSVGICNAFPTTLNLGEFFNGGITSGDNRYAVIKYTKYYSLQTYSYLVKGEAALLFERVP